MASDMFGGNLEHMDRLGKEFTTQSQAVTTLTNAIDHLIDENQTHWTGPFAGQFRTKWHTDFKRALNQLKAALDEAAKTVHGRREAIFTATK